MDTTAITARQVLDDARRRDIEDTEEIVAAFPRRIETRRRYRDDRIVENAARHLCRARGHRANGIRGCGDCRADVRGAAS